MHETDGQGSKKLIQPEPAQDRPIWVRIDVRIQMHVDLRTVAMNVLVDEAVVYVPMRVHDIIVAVVRRVAVCDALRDACKVEDAEQDEHQADGQFHGETDARWNDHIEENDGSADTEDGDGVADAPEDANDSGLPDAALTTHDRGDSDDVVGIRGVTNTKNKSQTDCCREIHHAVLSQLHKIEPVRRAGIPSAASDNFIILMTR
jgi:hypothetical protein